MILYKCDLCKKIVPEKETCRLTIGNTFERDTYDICNECKTKLEKIIKGADNERETSM